MGKKGGDDNGAAAARADEQQRQQRVREGTSRINAIFDGGTVTKAGTPGGDGLLGALAGGGETTSETLPGMFTKDFYDKRRQSYVDYAMPQLDKQFGDVKKKLTFDLARNGTLESSSRASREGELTTEYDKSKRGVLDEALNVENTARDSIEGARGDLIKMLNTTGDAEGAADSAIHRATALSAQPGYSPLGQMFATATSALSTQAAAERAQALSGGMYKAPFNTGLFANNGAVKVTT